MMDKISNIRVLDTKAVARAETIEMAERVLDLARSGEIIDLAWSASSLDGSIKTSFTSTSDSHRRLSAASRLVHRLQRAMDEADGE